MSYLLDSHILLWHFAAPERISSRARAVLTDPASELVVSVVSLWELGLKASLGKLDGPRPLVPYLEERVATLGARMLGILPAHARRFEELPRLHGDPFDRMLAAQALAEGLALITADALLAQYPIALLRGDL